MLNAVLKTFLLRFFATNHCISNGCSFLTVDYLSLSTKSLSQLLFSIFIYKDWTKQ